MALIGSQEAEKKLVQYLEENPDEMDRLIKDGAAMQNFEQTIEKYEGCENLSAIFNSVLSSKASATEEEIEAHLKSKVECEYAEIFYRMGKQANETEGQKN